MNARVPRRRPVALAALILLLALVGPGAWGGAAAQDAGCTPGTGLDLSGQRVTADQVGVQDDLRCADLTGADLSRLDLTQADLTGALAAGASFADATLIQAELGGADLTDAVLAGAELTQAELPGATLVGADLRDVDAGQVDLSRAVLRGADLSGADLVQADLRRADLTDADLSGAELTQAQLRGATLDGVKGVPQWGLWITIGCGVLLVVLIAFAVRRALRSPTRSSVASPTMGRGAMAGAGAGTTWAPGGYGPATMPGGAAGSVAAASPVSTWGTTAPGGLTSPMGAGYPTASSARERSVAVKVLWGVAGSLIAVLGIHLFLGGMLGSVAGAFNPLLDTAAGPLAVVGVGAGVLGTVVGVPLALFGLFVRSNCD